MARKNNKKKFRRQHASRVEKDKEHFQKLDENLKKLKEENEQEKTNPEKEKSSSKDGMIIEDAKRTKKIRKNKFLQKRSVVYEKKKKRKLRTAPILITEENRMAFE